ncbi:MAG TPA: hypothetical protein VL974_14725 [Magnetospirillum sp.]|jgi:hypothetical protein|nr:hypothetical protein [Magnetospirillum sp.]
MDYRLHEMHQLSELLEAEANGHPFDRARARLLAGALAEYHPEIRNSMRLICDRLERHEIGRRG